MVRTTYALSDNFFGCELLLSALPEYECLGPIPEEVRENKQVDLVPDVVVGVVRLVGVVDAAVPSVVLLGDGLAKLGIELKKEKTCSPSHQD